MTQMIDKSLIFCIFEFNYPSDIIFSEFLKFTFEFFKPLKNYFTLNSRFHKVKRVCKKACILIVY